MVILGSLSFVVVVVLPFFPVPAIPAFYLTGVFKQLYHNSLSQVYWVFQFARPVIIN